MNMLLKNKAFLLGLVVWLVVIYYFLPFQPKELDYVKNPDFSSSTLVDALGSGNYAVLGKVALDGSGISWCLVY